MPSGACTPFSPCTLFPGAPREGEQERVASDLSHCKWEVVRQGAPVLKKWGLQTDRRGGKGHVRILTDIRRKRNMYVCVHAHTHRGPGRSRRDRRGPGSRLWGRPQALGAAAGSGAQRGPRGVVLGTGKDGSSFSRSRNYTDKVWRGATPVRELPRYGSGGQGRIKGLHSIDHMNCFTIKRYFYITCEIKNKLN